MINISTKKFPKISCIFAKKMGKMKLRPRFLCLRILSAKKGQKTKQKERSEVSEWEINWCFRKALFTESSIRSTSITEGTHRQNRKTSDLL